MEIPPDELARKKQLEEHQEKKRKTENSYHFVVYLPSGNQPNRNGDIINWENTVPQNKNFTFEHEQLKIL